MTRTVLEQKVNTLLMEKGLTMEEFLNIIWTKLLEAEKKSVKNKFKEKEKYKTWTEFGVIDYELLSKKEQKSINELNDNFNREEYITTNEYLGLGK